MSRTAACVHQGAPISARSNRRFLRFADGAVGSDAVTTTGTPARFSRGCNARRATPPGCQDGGTRGITAHPKHPIHAEASSSHLLNGLLRTRPHTPSEGVISLLCVLRSSTAEPDVMQIIFDCCCQARRQHHTVKRERKKPNTSVKLHVCVSKVQVRTKD